MKKIAILVLTLFSFNLFALSLKLKDNAVITGENILLKQVAEVVKGDNKKWESVKNYKVGHFSLSASKTVIPLSRFANISKDLHVTFVNLKSLTVLRNVKKLSNKDFKEMVKDYILTRNKNIKVISVKSPKTVFIPFNSKIFVDTVSSKTLCGNFPLTFVVTDKLTNKKIKYINIRVTTVAKLKVAVADSNIKRGEKLTLGNIRFEEREFRNLRRQPLTVDKLKDIIAKNTIREGNVIFSNNYEKRPSVFKNQKVVVLVEEEGIKVEMTGIAKEDGCKGSIVRVYNPDSRKIIKALVIGNNKAKIL